MQMSSSPGLWTLLTIRFYSHVQHGRLAWVGVRRRLYWWNQGKGDLRKGRSPAGLCARCLKCEIFIILPASLKGRCYSPQFADRQIQPQEGFCDFPKVTSLGRGKAGVCTNACLNSELRFSSLNLADSPLFVQWCIFKLLAAAQISPNMDQTITQQQQSWWHPNTSRTTTTYIAFFLVKGHPNYLHFGSSQPSARIAGLWLVSSFYRGEKPLGYQQNEFCIWCVF